MFDIKEKEVDIEVTEYIDLCLNCGVDEVVTYHKGIYPLCQGCYNDLIMNDVKILDW